MGRKKADFTSDDPLKDKLQPMDEELSTTEDFEGDVIEEVTTSKSDAELRADEEDDKSHVQKLVLAVKRGRGRPRLSDKVKKKRAAIRGDENTVKRKRGRPRKNSLPNGTTTKIPKSPRGTVPRILFSSFMTKDYPRKRRGRPRKNPMLPSGSSSSSSSTGRNTGAESRLGSQVDRLASLVDRLENRINLDGLIDEYADIESEQEIDRQIYLLQRNFNVKIEEKKEFKDVVKSYLEDLAIVPKCLLTSVRSYKESGRIILYEVWESEGDHLEFAEGCSSKIFEKEATDMLKFDTVVNSMNIPARWWQRAS